MKKFSAIFLIFSLILFTALIKNSTKRIDDEIFVVKENIRILKKNYDNIKLENDYLSSTEKLIELQKLYFEDELIPQKIDKIKIINKNFDKLKVEKLKFKNEK